MYVLCLIIMVSSIVRQSFVCLAIFLTLKWWPRLSRIGNAVVHSNLFSIV